MHKRAPDIAPELTTASKRAAWRGVLQSAQPLSARVCWAYALNKAGTKWTKEPKQPWQPRETVLLGTVGQPHCFGLPSLFDGIRREHSRKPDEFYQMITRATPGVRLADLFAREKREGCDCWDDEVGKFSSGPGAIERDAILMNDDEQAGVRS
jgi:N6-adenosine-specific RNA methylase IME4